MLCCKQETFSGILDKQEFARGRTITPQHDLALPILLRLNALADESVGMTWEVSKSKLSLGS